MNSERRKAIKAAINDLERIRSDLKDCQTDEEDYKDNMPENLKEGEKGEAAQTAIDALDTACDSLQDAIDELGNLD